MVRPLRDIPPPKPAPLKGLAITAIVVAVLAGGAVGLLNALRPDANSAAGRLGLTQEGPYRAYARGPLAKLETWARPRPGPRTRFNDADGRPVSLADFRGKVVIVNVWATWCAPCVTEMPTLAALRRAVPDPGLVVAPVSVDRPDDLPDARNFIGVHEPLRLFHDPRFALPAELGAKGLPSTIFYDRQGREVARLAGEAKWDSPEAIALTRALLRAR